MGARHLVCSVIVAIVAIVAIGVSRAEAQGVLQNTYDRGAWPTQEEQRTIVIPAAMWQLQAEAGITSVDNRGPTFYDIVPTLAYGLSRNLTIGASQFTTIDTVSGTDAMGTPTSSTDVRFGRGSVFAIARPFNDYDIGFRVDVPFTPNDPTEVRVGAQLVGHVSLSLERIALFFNTGLQVKAFADDNVADGNTYLANVDLVFQINPQFAIRGGGQLNRTTFALSQAMASFESHEAVFDVHGGALYALGNGVDLFGRVGLDFGDQSGPFATAGVTVWR